MEITLFLLCIGLLALLYFAPVWSRRPHKEIIVCALVFFFLFTHDTQAGAAPTNAVLTWTRATTLIDGTAIPAASHKETLIQWFRAGNPTTIVGEVRIASPAVTTTVSGLICGDYTFVAFTVLTDNAQSGPSGSVVKATAIACAPNPPTGLSAT